jgi:hypothetical protein
MLAWPWVVVTKLDGAARYQTPYHWAAVYGLMAGLLMVFDLMRPEEDPPNEAAEPPDDEIDTRIQAG